MFIHIANVRAFMLGYKHGTEATAKWFETTGYRTVGYYEDMNPQYAFEFPDQFPRPTPDLNGKGQPSFCGTVLVESCIPALPHPRSVTNEVYDGLVSAYEDGYNGAVSSLIAAINDRTFYNDVITFG